MTADEGRRFTLVLGGGGAVGIAYLCGVLRALEEVGHLDVRGAEVMIGTSAGAVVGAELRLGRDYDDILQHAGVQPMLDETREEQHELAPAWSSRADFARRLIGSSWVLGRSMIPLVPAVPAPPRALERMFPASLFSMTADAQELERFPQDWPEERLWLVAFDPDSRRREVLRAEADDWRACGLPDAVLASCTPPGILPPVWVGGRRLVDGGAHSVTNLDLAAQTGSPVVIAVAPLAYDPRQPPTRLLAMSRRRINGRLATEARVAAGSGAEVLLLRPTGDELRHHGFNLLRQHANEVVYEAAYMATARRLGTDPALRALEAAGARC